MKSRKQLSRKETVVIAAMDAYAPVMQLGIDPYSKLEALKATASALKEYPLPHKARRFAFATNIPDYCAAAAENLCRLATVQPDTGIIMHLHTIGQLLGIALEYLQKLLTAL